MLLDKRYFPIKINIPEARAKIPVTMGGIATPATLCTPITIKKMDSNNMPRLLVIFIVFSSRLSNAFIEWGRSPPFDPCYMTNSIFNPWEKQGF